MSTKKTTHDAEQKKLWRKELRDLQRQNRQTEAARNKQVAALRREIDRIEKNYRQATLKRAERIATLKGRLGL